MAEHQIGHRVEATIKAIKGNCSAGHKVGDKFNLSMHSSDGLCAVFFHDLFPWVLAFQLGGELPWGDGDSMEVACMDKFNEVTMELRKIK